MIHIQIWAPTTIHSHREISPSRQWRTQEQNPGGARLGTVPVSSSAAEREQLCGGRPWGGQSRSWGSGGQTWRQAQNGRRRSGIGSRSCGWGSGGRSWRQLRVHELPWAVGQCPWRRQSWALDRLGESPGSRERPSACGSRRAGRGRERIHGGIDRARRRSLVG
jgi:hypothetical protein